MAKIIDKLTLLNSWWRYGFIVIVGLTSAFALYQNIIEQQTVQIRQHQNEFLKLKAELKKYQNNLKQMRVEQSHHSQLNQRLGELEKLLENYDHNVPQRILLDAALTSKIKPEEIKVSRQLDDEFGYYFVVDIKILGDQQYVSEFFSKLLSRNELSIWEKLTFQQVSNQLSMSLTTRYYFEIFNDNSE